MLEAINAVVFVLFGCIYVNFGSNAVARTAGAALIILSVVNGVKIFA